MSRSSLAPRRLLGVAGLLVLALCASCGEAGQVEQARLQLRYGNLDTAASLLEGTGGVSARSLLDEIAATRVARARLEERLAELVLLAPEAEREELDALLKHSDDPIARDWIERAISSSVDRAAAQRVARGSTRGTRHGGRLDGPDRISGGSSGSSPAPSGARRSEPPTSQTLDTASLDASRAAMRARIEAREWSEALAELDMALAAAGARAGEFRALRDDVRDRALGEALELLARAERADEEGRLEEARDLLLEAAPRFPHAGPGASLQAALRDYEGRLEILALAEEATGAAGSAAPPLVASTPSIEYGGDPAQLAAALERGGDLAGALEAYLEAGFAALPGAERDGLIARAHAIERRLLLRSEILAARELQAAEFERELGLVGGDETLLRLTGGPSSWDAWPLEKLKRAASRSQLSQEAQLGLLDERLRRGDVAGRSGALATLARFVEEDLVEESAAWELVAAQRGELVPDGGYVWQRGAWISKRDQLDEFAGAQLAKLEKKFKKVRDEAERDELWAQLEVLGPAAEATRTALLEARWEKALQAVRKGSTLGALARVAQDREELDHRRERALELIFDEEEYFYPYRPPECPPEKARLYWPVQQRVDELVAALREVWYAAKPVKLSASFRQGLADLSWALERGPQVGLALELPAELPAWVWAVPLELDAVSLHEFAWNPGEREALAYDRAVGAYNVRSWEHAEDLPEDEQPERSERRQVEVTNEYRGMFGRRALAWNPKVQVAADMHSDYMADTGDFGHFEKGDPERRSPFDRMRLAGYNQGVSENCHMGNGSPEGAHDGWIHSSGHHRNILMPGHREMASAVTSGYWTQNFGTGTAFKAELAD